MLEEFKKFALRGNVVDLAIGVIIGAAFGKIVESLVGDLFMPIIGAVTGGLDFSNYYLPLSGKVPGGMAYAEAKRRAPVLGWGTFVPIATNFMIIAWVLFVVVKGNNLSFPRDSSARPSFSNPHRHRVFRAFLRAPVAS